MTDAKFIVEYKGKQHHFKYGSEVYIFDTLLYNDVTDEDQILSMVDACHAAYLKDDNRTPLGALADYVAENWDELKKMSASDIISEFYENGGGELW